MSRPHIVDVIAGDGIGLEVVPAALRCVDALAEQFGFAVTWRDRDWGSERYRRTGAMMPEDGLARLADGDAILLGAVGAPDIPDDVTLWGLLLPIRRAFLQYVNLRPVRSLPGVPGPLSDGSGIDLVIVRENVEGEYSEIGGRIYRGRPEEAAVQETVFTRRGVDRVARFAARLAASRRGGLTSATKSNGIVHTMPFWDEVVAGAVERINHSGPETPIRLRKVLVDALAADLVLRPREHDVIVASNLLGDILSDLASAVVGGIGTAPSANLNPEREHPSMFEPVHGSAPDIAGTGIANPTGQIWATSLMLDHLGESTAAAALLAALEAALASGVRTRDLGGTAGTDEFTSTVLDHLTTTTEELSDA
ncbi:MULTISPECIES: isocitrate/isopropylmalate dehydrogenase family protein [Pseudonocardia]|uniref:D-malate dehydrogenase [decarboxylating] n=2 Tax=Pseudonocardia TaxID=1847 RepID=A0A1Y2MHR5_PSEAH|nr:MULTISPECIES: isocitrate/isopropylmalate family dehydrogenase [Pseudonocardia]OSY34824.1 D-malate dehydrogenase [decarboxylating] [Pseudonocardia autotrophica]TDN73019.1 tartrate dehydrogenase/decarboxylase/D-malate dehydrogenase [Pseudonocardia autotrophica]BBG03738.1 tartrate dehydrogenase [Pseudonocardia autotrophica]GEC29277.1 tartrate dehydrogenase [Pseudonocardia saturnea]